MKIPKRFIFLLILIITTLSCAEPFDDSEILSRLNNTETDIKKLKESEEEMRSEFDISFEIGEQMVVSPSSSYDIPYRITSLYDSLTIELAPSADLLAKAIPNSDPHTGVIHVETGESIGENSQVLVFVSNGHKLVMRAIHFEQQVLSVSNNATYWVNSDTSEILLHFMSNAECKIMIPEESIGWLTAPATKTVTEQSLRLKVARNNGDIRESKVWVVTGDEKLKVEFLTRQHSDPLFLQAEVDKERAILEKWYRECGGDNWSHHENWCSDKPLNEWEGVWTNYGGFVWWISLPSNNMEGTLPEEIWEMKHLETFVIPGNNLEIRIPDDPDKLSSSFTYINIGNFSNAVGSNHIVGGLPHSMSKFQNLVHFYAPCMQIEGEIPDEIWSLPELTYLGLGYNRLEGELSPAIGNAKKLKQLDIPSNRLYGSIPEAFGELENLNIALLGNTSALMGFDNELECNHFTSLPKSMGNLDQLYTLWISSTGLEGPLPEGFYDCEILGNIQLGTIGTKAGYKNRLGTLSEKFGEMPYLYYVNANNAGLTGSVPGTFGNAQYLESLHLASNNLTGNIPEELADAVNLTNLNLQRNRLTGEVPERIMNCPQASGWLLDPQQEGYGLSFNLYESTDYSRDGRVTVLQRATKGRGIDIVLLGDAFCDTDLADGTYQRTMYNVVDNFFSVEPYSSFRDCFNVYMVDVVSENNRYAPGAKHALSTGFGSGTYIYGNDSKCFQYAQKAVGEDRMDEVLIIVVLNRKYYAGTCYMYHPDESQGDFSNGPSIAYFPLGNDADMFRGLVQHEAGGHGFAKLDDEYDYGNEVNGSFVESRSKMFSWGWWANIDFTDNPDEVKWARFLSDSRYANEGLGVFEGGATYGKGVWRPTENSIMRYNTGSFNAPSREAIYKRINKLANGNNWQYNYEQFVAWDAVNRAATKTRPRGWKTYEPLAKPVVTGKSWRNASSAPVTKEESPVKRFQAESKDKEAEVTTAHAGNTSIKMSVGYSTTTTTVPELSLPR